MQLMKLSRKTIDYSLATLIILLAIVLIAFAIKGDRGFPIYYQSERDGSVGGPFESSGSNSRFALTEAIVEDGSLFFDDKKAKFAAPDLVFYNQKYFSIFTPGVSFLAVPFYMLGKLFNLQQLFSYSLNHFLLIINGFLIFKLSRKLNVPFWPSIVSGMVFVFATNALAYSLTFTQHMLSSFVILLSHYTATFKRIFLRNTLFSLLFGLGILADIPNVIMFIPAGLYILLKNFEILELKNKIRISLKTAILGLLLGVLPMLFVFGWYNSQVTGSPTLLGQFIGRSDYPPAQNIQNQTSPQKTDSGGLLNSDFKIWNSPFETRLMLQGFYLLLLSDERGWIYYSPVIFVGILGLLLHIKMENENTLSKILFSTGMIIFLIYSMFGDPWGGWGFGPRYLIPAGAVFSVGTGYAIGVFRRKLIFHFIFLIILLYSIWVSSIGALTSNAIPPKNEALNLGVPISYTYQFNLGLIGENRSSSLIYNTLFKDLVPVSNFVYSFVFLSFLVFIAAYLPIILPLINGRQK